MRLHGKIINISVLKILADFDTMCNFALYKPKGMSWGHQLGVRDVMSRRVGTSIRDVCACSSDFIAEI